MKARNTNSDPDIFFQILRDEDRWEFPRHQLKILSMLGEGSFGQVWKCEAENIDGVKGVFLDVAISYQNISNLNNPFKPYLC